MIKLTLQDYWQSEDDITSIVDDWVADENSKIPEDIREKLREFFPHIGISPDEADAIPESVAQHITTHSIAYRNYVINQKESAKSSSFEQEIFKYLQELYVLLEFYSSFIETVLIKKRANMPHVKESSAKVRLSRNSKKGTLQPKTDAQEDIIALITQIESALQLFESVVPVNVAKYIDYSSYQIPEDTTATYTTATELVRLGELKEQAVALFEKHGYIQTGRTTFISKYDTNKAISAYDEAEELERKRQIETRFQALYSLLEFFDAFVDALLIAKGADDFYKKTSSIQVESDLLNKELDICPKTKKEKQMLEFIVNMEKVLQIFENVMPVEIEKYIDYDIHKISGDSLAMYNIASEMHKILDIKKQVDEFLKGVEGD